MSTTATALLESSPVAEQQSADRLVLRGFDWPTYRKISEAFTGHHVRLSYSRGILELMTISSRHGTLSRLLGRFITVLTEELGLPVRGCGDMTCDREDLERGLEPDECFYIENEPLVRAKEDIDLASDPPPDIAVEVDISRSSRTRMGTYAALGVPEVWRCDSRGLTFFHLVDGAYAESASSRHFPFVTSEDVTRFLHQRGQMDENSLVQTFRQWVRTTKG